MDEQEVRVRCVVCWEVYITPRVAFELQANRCPHTSCGHSYKAQQLVGPLGPEDATPAEGYPLDHFRPTQDDLDSMFGDD